MIAFVAFQGCISANPLGAKSEFFAWIDVLRQLTKGEGITLG